MVDLEDSTIDRLAELIEARNGFVFQGNRRRRLETRLRECAGAAGFGSLAEYHRELLATPAVPGGLWQTLTDAIINDESSWFRYPDQFETLRRFVLPAIVSNKEFSNGREIRILSAGCSRGQEPYSIAMTVAECEEVPVEMRVSIMALDICTRNLTRARKAVYTTSELRGLSEERIARHFQQERGYWRLEAPLASAVEFRQHNLVQPIEYGAFDIIFCRNVTIYFTRERTLTFLEGLVQAMQPGGHLFAGHAEAYSGLVDELKPIWFGSHLVYRRSRLQSVRHLAAPALTMSTPCTPEITQNREAQ